MATHSAPTPTTFSWLLDPRSQSLPALRDEFVVRAFRLVLDGNELRLALEGSSAIRREQEARQLAETYAKALGRGLGPFLRLMTERELGSLPAYASDDGSWQLPSVHRVPRDPRSAIREARNVLLASSDETLRSCYNYIQDAEEHPKESLFYLYKAVEAIQNRLGGEREAIAALNAIATLNIAPAFKNVKRLANESVRDERHAPSDPTMVQQVTASEKESALEDTRTVLRTYEKYLRSTGLL
jgi:hypothetical protein